jgi:hypothetical protein
VRRKILCGSRDPEAIEGSGCETDLEYLSQRHREDTEKALFFIKPKDLSSSSVALATRRGAGVRRAFCVCSDNGPLTTSDERPATDD